MALFNGIEKDYYEGDNLGNYQFVSLEDIINQFMAIYVGYEKIINKVNRMDVAFFAQRALAEMSFDTFKSIKSQQIEVPNTQIMPLPHDYVNYTKLSSVDAVGIKHVIYPTTLTSNPFQIDQKSNGKYNFDFITNEKGLLKNHDFSLDLSNTWKVVSPLPEIIDNPIIGGMAIENGVLKTSFHTRTGNAAYQNGSVHACWQALDVSGINYLDLSADGVADSFNILFNSVNYLNTGTVRVGISTQPPENNTVNNSNNQQSAAAATLTSNNVNSSIFDLLTYQQEASFVEWVGPTTVGSTTATKELLNVDVSNHNTVYVVIVSFVDFTTPAQTPSTASNLGGTGIPFLANTIDNVLVTSSFFSESLKEKPGNEGKSSTWDAFKNLTPFQLQNDDYEDHIYWPNHGERYGLDPSLAQVNGSFYIDELRGNIHFSSNLSGKNVILDYISDSLGTEEEMQVHKFAEEAMYQTILYNIMATKRNVGRQQIADYRKRMFAATRKAKLRLSNIKLEELTRILRGKSKQIKH